MTDERSGISRREALAAGAGLALAPAMARFGAGPAQAAAPMLGVSRPTHYRFGIGAFEVTTVFDGAVQLDGPHPIFGQNVSAEEVHALAERNFLPKTRFENPFTPVLVNTGSELVLFDTGNGARRRPHAGRFAAHLRQIGHTAEQVDVVVISHCHPDHIGGLMEDGRPLFPNARYMIGETEYDFWSHDDRLSEPVAGVARLVRANVVPLADRMSFLKPGDEVVAGIRAVEAFGHTPGHIAFHIESEDARLMLTADTANHYVASLQRPEWHVRFDMDKDKAVAARRRLFDMIASERIPFAGYHMPFPAVGFVERAGRGFRFVPASYQLNL